MYEPSIQTLLEPLQIQKIKQGDSSAFEELFHSYYSDLCNFALKFSPDASSAEETVQEMFFKFWEKRNDIQIQSSVRSYLFGSVRNLCLNHIKHSKIKDRHSQYVRHTQNEQDEGAHSIENVELESKILEAIESMPEERRKIFRLSRFEHKKYREIAHDLGISIKTVEAQMGKALKFMRTELTDYLVWIVVFAVEFIDKFLSNG